MPQVVYTDIKYRHSCYTKITEPQRAILIYMWPHWALFAFWLCVRGPECAFCLPSQSPLRHFLFLAWRQLPNKEDATAVIC